MKLTKALKKARFAVLASKRPVYVRHTDYKTLGYMLEVDLLEVRPVNLDRVPMRKRVFGANELISNQWEVQL